MKDLVLLVADKDAQFAIKGALNRPDALGIRPIQFDFRVHSGHDGGARTSGVEMLALERTRFSHALLVFDFEGSGTDRSSAIDLEVKLDQDLRQHWGQRAKTIVIEPEVDGWMWGSDNVLRELLGWSSSDRIRDWLREQGYTFGNNEKPERPKEALIAVSRRCNVARSSSLYEKIASRLSLTRCVDPAFLRLREQLATWFGPED